VWKNKSLIFKNGNVGKVVLIRVKLTGYTNAFFLEVIPTWDLGTESDWLGSKWGLGNIIKSVGVQNGIGNKIKRSIPASSDYFIV